MFNRQVLPFPRSLPPEYHPTTNHEAIKTLITPVQTHINNYDREWLAAVCLDQDDRVVDDQPRIVYLHSTCGLPDAYPYDRLWDHAKECHATKLVTVRYHPHRWHGPSIEGIRRFDRMYREAAAYGIEIVQHLIVDREGQVVSFWCQPTTPLTEGGGSASRRRRSSTRLASVVTHSSKLAASLASTCGASG